jgi:catechol 2,3-dioxygenase-like lactoylglutathione lyase family enzyme
MPAPPGMFEIQLVVDDLAAMRAFYRDRLGLEVSVDDEERGRVHFRLRDGQLILARAKGEEGSPDWPGLPPPLLTSADRAGRAPLGHGPVHFAFEVESRGLVARGEQLRTEGLDVRGPYRWPSGRLSIYFRDPEGNVAELISTPSAR